MYIVNKAGFSKIKEAIGLFSCVIKSGEDWTMVCEEVKNSVDEVIGTLSNKAFKRKQHLDKFERQEVKDFLAKYEDAVGNFPTPEQALLLKYFYEAGDDLPLDWGCSEGFQKAFRQVDVIYNKDFGSKDMVVWNLMHIDDIIWKVLADFYGETYE